jgi:hypothetical protein
LITQTFEPTTISTSKSDQIPVTIVKVFNIAVFLVAAVAVALPSTQLKVLSEREFCGFRTSGYTATYINQTIAECFDSTASKIKLCREQPGSICVGMADPVRIM